MGQNPSLDRSDPIGQAAPVQTRGTGMGGDTAAREFRERLDHVAQATESMLERLLSTDALPGETVRPPRLVEAMRYAALGGGKRLRPFLVVETARLFGAESEGVLRTGAALEMIHCYSLVHDDLPAMDDDDLRRGRPTAHRAFDEATAILAGDALLTYAFDVVADPVTHPNPAVRSELVLKLARASGLGGMVGGQVLDLAAEQKAEKHTEKSVRELQAMKTGALLLYAVEAGAILGGADAKQSAALSRYGAALGAAFQVADDILDEEGDEAALGKRAGKDAGRNKATLVAALGMEAARTRRDRLAEEAIAALKDGGFGEHASVLAQAARFTVERRN
jgi:farnesyl diphosphate synthase